MRTFLGFLSGVFVGGVIVAVIFLALSAIFPISESTEPQATAAATIVEPTPVNTGANTGAESSIATQPAAQPAVTATASGAENQTSSDASAGVNVSATSTPPAASSAPQLASVSNAAASLSANPSPAFRANALPFNLSPTSRALAIVIVAAPGVDLTPLMGLPLSVALDPRTQADLVRRNRSMGFEVLTLLDQDTRNSAPTLAAAITAIRGSVGVLESVPGADAAANLTLLSILAQQGLGYIAQSGFGGILAQAREAGLPGMAIGGTISPGLEPVAARAALDRAVIDTRQSGNQVMVVYADAAMVGLLRAWADTPAPRGVTLAPVSAVMRTR